VTTLVEQGRKFRRTIQLGHRYLTALTGLKTSHGRVTTQKGIPQNKNNIMKKLVSICSITKIVCVPKQETGCLEEHTPERLTALRERRPAGAGPRGVGVTAGGRAGGRGGRSSGGVPRNPSERYMTEGAGAGGKGGGQDMGSGTSVAERRRKCLRI